MSGTEAAASLFGSADSSSDPFATLGQDFGQEAPDDLFGGASADHSAQPDAVNVFDSLTDQAPSNDFADTGHSQPAAQDHGHTPNSYAPVPNKSAPIETCGTYGSHQQWDGSQTYYDTGVPNNTSYDANEYVPLTTHDPYEPPQATAYAPSSNYQHPPPQPAAYSYPGNQTSTYDDRHVADPYAPSQLVNQSAYAPYEPYAPRLSAKPVASTHQQPYAVPPAPSYTSPPPPPKATVAAVPPPPAPTAAQVNRPKVLNAYDPPFPVTSYSRRNVSGPAKYGQGHTTPAHSAYVAYQSSTPPPLPPPPPRAPVSPSISAPPLRPPSNQHGYASTYAPPPAQPPPSQQASANGAQPLSSEPSPFASTAYSASVPPPSTGLSVSTKPQNNWSHSLENRDEHNAARALPEDRSENVASGSNFFDEVGQQEQSFELQPPPTHAAPPPSDTTSPRVKPAQPQTSNGLISSSLQSSARALSPPPPRASLDSARVSISRQDPRPPSASPPVSGLSHPPRASPDFRKETLVRTEQVPRSKTTSPSIDGSNNAVNPYAPPLKGSALRQISAPVHSTDRVSSPESSPGAAHDRYAHRGTRISNVYGIERASSPSSLSTRSSDSQHSTKPPPPNYLPPVTESSYTPATFMQEPAAVVEDPYAPPQHNRVIKPPPSFGYGQSPYGYGTDLSPPQETTVKSTITPYAPSPSLMGANDPLGRTSVRVPVISFGFGGKIITCFHDSGSLNTGFDVALSSRTSTKIQVQNWKDLVPESALDSTEAFPGPLHADPGPPSTSLMKAGATAQAKTKKTSLLKYLSDRADEITQGLGYLHSSSVEKRTAEGKLVLVKLLKIMVENDGRLLGTGQLDSAVRGALVPRLEGLMSANDSGASFTTTADAAGLLAETPYGSMAAVGDMAPISVTTLRGAALDKIEEFLLRGERRQAYHYALDEKLWAHAMVIASSIDKEAWKEVVNEFIRAELGVKGEGAFTMPGRTDTQVSSVNGREGLRVAYSTFSGQGTTAVQELVPKSILTRANGRLPVPAPAIPAPTLGQPTPRTPNFALPAAGTKIPAESLAKWAETVAMLLVSPLTPDTSAALTGLGDQLMTNGWLEAAHVCFLLSPQTSPVGGVGNPAARIVLLSSKSPATVPTFSKDSDSIIFTEILEYALATAPVPKGQEPNHGFPHLQAYRLIRAYAAAEAGDLGIASRYCEAITASLVRGSVYFNATMLEQLKCLADRLSGVSHGDKSNSWMAGKISKPSLDTIGGWLEGRLAKFVTGESDDPASPQEDASKQDVGHGFTGPFAHYNTISSTASSARTSPAPTFVTPAYALPPQRTGSAMSNKASYNYGMPATEPHSPPPGPSAQVMSASAAMASFPSIQTQMNDYNHRTSSPYSNGYSPSSDLQTPKPSLNRDGDETDVRDTTQEVSWWGSSGPYGRGGNDDTGKTPTVAHFERVEETHGGMDNNGFFSPMMNQSFTVGPQSSRSSTPGSAPSSARHGQTSSYGEDDEDDLGLGNSSRKKKESPVDGGGQQDAKPAAAAPPAKEAGKIPDASGQNSGWLSRWWGRKENTSGGPVKASLGEESSFYYDKEQKRWVNKKGGAEAPKATPPPPPPLRAQTASPGMMAGGPGGSGPPPPANGMSANNGMNGGAGLGRPASAIDLTTSPPTSKPVTRTRSSLAPPGLDSAPPTPTGTRIASGSGGPPPPSRPKSSTSQKRSVRSRYVDVFAQEGGSGV